MKRFFFLFRLHRSIPFLFRFFTNKTVPWWKRLFFASAIVGYGVLPLDVIPEVLPVIGVVDDVVIIGFLLDWMQRIVKKVERKENNAVKEENNEKIEKE